MESSERKSGFGCVCEVERTHRWDATPITLGQEFSGYAATRHGIERVMLPASRG